jgi:hypothetical protein
MKIIALLALYFVTGSVTFSQNLIGFRNDEIKRFMIENNSNMNFVKVTNNKFHYLKYSDNSDSQTLLFFLNTDSICKSIRIICDSGTKNEKVKQFDSLYKKSGENKWIDSRGGKNFLVEIKDEKWSSIITIEPYK